MTDPRVSRGAVADALFKIGAFKFGHFTLSSGKTSSYYLDLRIVPSFPAVYSMAVEAYKGEAEVIGVKNFDAIGGVATAGLTFSSPLALALGRPMVYVRSEAKGHGLGKQVEGIVKSGARVVVVDDLATSGESIAVAVDALRRNDFTVADAIVLVDRQEGASSNLEKIGVRLRPYVTIRELVDLLSRSGKITKDEYESVKAQLGRKNS